METELFTVVIAHYKQFEFLPVAITSVLKQTYKNIQLIIADDCSLSTKQQKEIEKYICDNKKDNIKSVDVLTNPKNIGTVKNINNALDHAEGEYILFFAADDALYDKDVILNFSDSFQKNKERNIITCQSYLYDKDLRKNTDGYVNAEYAINVINEMTALEQFAELSYGCFYAAGSTAYRKEVFKKNGKFNEDYILVEDWSYWLHVTRNGEKIYYVDFNGLKHRDGGISHSTYSKNNISESKKQYYKDIIRIFDNELLNYINILNLEEQKRIFSKYKEHLMYFEYAIPDICIKKKKNVPILMLKSAKIRNSYLINYLKKIVKRIIKYCFIYLLLRLGVAYTDMIDLSQINMIIIALISLDVSEIVNRKFINK